MNKKHPQRYPHKHQPVHRSPRPGITAIFSSEIGSKWPKMAKKWLKFFGGPDMSSMPPTSEIDEPHTVVFKASGIYLYGCTPHADMGMLGLVIVDNDFHNLNAIKQIQFSRVGKSVLQRLLKIAQAPLSSK